MIGLAQACADSSPWTQSLQCCVTGERVRNGPSNRWLAQRPRAVILLTPSSKWHSFLTSATHFLKCLFAEFGVDRFLYSYQLIGDDDESINYVLKIFLKLKRQLLLLQGEAGLHGPQGKTGTPGKPGVAGPPGLRGGTGPSGTDVRISVQTVMWIKDKGLAKRNRRKSYLGWLGFTPVGSGFTRKSDLKWLAFTLVRSRFTHKSNLGWLAVTLIGSRFTHKSAEVFHCLATQGKWVQFVRASFVCGLVYILIALKWPFFATCA